MVRRSALIAFLIVVLSTMPGCSSAAGRSTACAASSLSLGIGAPVAVGGDQSTVALTVSNRLSAPCSIPKRPAVGLVSNDSARPSISVADQGVDTGAATPDDRIVIPAGGQVLATLTYLAGPDVGCDDTGPWTPTLILITLPEPSASLAAPWTGGSVDDCQEAATHPGTFVGPFEVTS